MIQHAFPIGAWVRDPTFHRITTGGLVNNGKGEVSFTPFRGEVIALLTSKRLLAYKIAFGDSENIILVYEVECDYCGARDDSTHQEWCIVKPGGMLRVVKHIPGYAPELEDVRDYEQAS